MRCLESGKYIVRPVVVVPLSHLALTGSWQQGHHNRPSRAGCTVHLHKLTALGHVVLLWSVCLPELRLSAMGLSGSGWCGLELHWHVFDSTADHDTCICSLSHSALVEKHTKSLKDVSCRPRCCWLWHRAFGKAGTDSQERGKNWNVRRFLSWRRRHYILPKRLEWPTKLHGATSYKAQKLSPPVTKDK